MNKLIVWLLLAVGAWSSMQSPVHAQVPDVALIDFAAPAFQRLWARSDATITDQRAPQSWLWGPRPISQGTREPYAQSSDTTRLVQYFDKARMEINNTNIDPNNLWYVTNGLLPIELIPGRMQVGDDQFEQRQPATIAAIGDPGNPFPTYADLNKVFTRTGAGACIGDPVTGFLSPDGSISGYDAYRDDPATRIDALEQQHGIPAAFLSYMNAQSAQLGRQFVFGQPVSGAYWVQVEIGRVAQPVMFQVYERRILTYTPRNPAPFQVESGNVGLHYLLWRYPAPSIAVTPTEAPAGTTFMLQIGGLANGETATITVSPAPVDPARQYTITGTGGTVTLPIPTTPQSAAGTWFVNTGRADLSPVISSGTQFTVTAP